MKSKNDTPAIKNNLEIKIVNYLRDEILSNRWKEYKRIHTKVLDINVETPEYTELVDKLRDLEEVINKQLEGISAMENRREMYKYINEREKQTAYLEFIEGAKWQQERMYSEEEVRKIAEEVRWQAI
jgi:CRISPR/Cas system-associated endonuclease/helicase Cas3